MSGIISGFRIALETGMKKVAGSCWRSSSARIRGRPSTAPYSPRSGRGQRSASPADAHVVDVVADVHRHLGAVRPRFGRQPTAHARNGHRLPDLILRHRRGRRRRLSTASALPLSLRQTDLRRADDERREHERRRGHPNIRPHRTSSFTLVSVSSSFRCLHVARDLLVRAEPDALLLLHVGDELVEKRRARAMA